MYWVACLCGIFNAWLYVATRENKSRNNILYLFLLYLFIHMIIGVITT